MQNWYMKTNVISFPIILLLMVLLLTCQKDELVPLNQFSITNEDVQTTATTAKFEVRYVYRNARTQVEGKMKYVKILYSKEKEMAQASQQEANQESDMYGTYFKATLTNLEALTTYYYCYEVANEVDVMKTEVKSFKTSEYGLPTLTSVNVSNITGVGFTLSCNVTDGGETQVLERGFCYSITNSSPDINGQHVAAGSGLGSFTAGLTGLTPSTTYYVRAYAKNAFGISYSGMKLVNTTTGVPVVVTGDVSSITSNTALCAANVTSDGGFPLTVKGVCWSTSPNPTVNNSHTSNGTATGAYSGYMTGLTASTTYYVRAYATNSKGTTYGEQKNFTTTSSQSSTWLYYDDGTYVNCWGLTSGGTDEWGIMFPSSIMSSYGGMKVSQIKAYFIVTGGYTLHLYQGTSSSSPSTQLLSQNISVSSTGWQTFSISPVYVSSSQNLWVTISASEAGTHPCCAAAGTNNPNARWKKSSSGTWYDIYNNNGGVDLTWMIRIALSSTKGEKSYEVELPQVPVESSKEGFIPESRRYVPGIDKPASQCSVKTTSVR
jgi:hypothetical protein